MTVKKTSPLETRSLGVQKHNDRAHHAQFADSPPREGSSPNEEQVLRQMKQLAWLMDEAVTIPGLNWRVGLDGLIGMIPGIGDLVSAGISGFIIRQAATLGVPKVILLRMAFNTAIDFLVGAIPLIGDLFDFAWKANRKNLQLVIGYLEDPTHTKRTSWFTVAGLLGGTVGAVLAVSLLVVSLISALF